MVGRAQVILAAPTRDRACWNSRDAGALQKSRDRANESIGKALVLDGIDLAEQDCRDRDTPSRSRRSSFWETGASRLKLVAFVSLITRF